MMKSGIGLEASLFLGSRSLLQSLLAISSSYKNLLASHYVGDLLKTYREWAEEEATQAPKMKSCLNLSEETREVLARVDLDDSIKALMKEAAESKPEEENEPHFYCGKLCIYYHKWDYVDLLYKLGHAQGSIPCTFKYVRGLQSDEEENERRHVVEVLKERFPGMATYLAACLVPDLTKRLEMYLRAGDLGFTKGYEDAGIVSKLLKRNPEESLDFYIKATKSKRMLGAFRKVAELAFQNDDFELAKKMYKEMGDLGDEYGYVKLGNILCDNEESSEEMKKYYLKAGEGGFHQLLFCISRTERPELKRKREELVLQNTRKLLRIAPDENI